MFKDLPTNIFRFRKFMDFKGPHNRICGFFLNSKDLLIKVRGFKNVLDFLFYLLFNIFIYLYFEIFSNIKRLKNVKFRGFKGGEQKKNK